MTTTTNTTSDFTGPVEPVRDREVEDGVDGVWTKSWGFPDEISVNKDSTGPETRRRTFLPTIPRPSDLPEGRHGRGVSQTRKKDTTQRDRKDW